MPEVRHRRGTGRSSVRDDSSRRSPSDNDEEHQASSSQRKSQARRRGKDGGRRHSRGRSRDRSRRHERRRSRSRSRKRSKRRSSRSQSQEYHRKRHHEERHFRRRGETGSTAAATDRVLAPQSSSGSVPTTAPAVTATEVTEVSRSPSVPGERSTTRILPTAVSSESTSSTTMGRNRSTYKPAPELTMLTM